VEAKASCGPSSSLLGVLCDVRTGQEGTNCNEDSCSEVSLNVTGIYDLENRKHSEK
jgi:hypothetical protein